MNDEQRKRHSLYLLQQLAYEEIHLGELNGEHEINADVTSSETLVVKFPEHYDFEITISLKAFITRGLIYCDVKDDDNLAKYRLDNVLAGEFRIYIAGGLLTNGDSYQDFQGLEPAARFFFSEVNAMLADKFIEPNRS